MSSTGRKSLCEFRCRQCGWVDTRPDKCTNCGSLREEPSDGAEKMVRLASFLASWGVTAS